jgi:hypothetical protein
MVVDPSKGKRAGAKFERDFLQWLREYAVDAERLRPTGTQDEGDIAVRTEAFDVVCELKAPGPGRPVQLGPWMAEAEIEAKNYSLRRYGKETLPVLVIKARNKPLEEAFVVLRAREFFGE